MAIGPVLQEARLKKKLTASQVAELTRMKVQIVNDLEHDDFHRVAATIYGKGFIKLFAECVDLDPAPLVADYMNTVRGDTKPDTAHPSAAADGERRVHTAEPSPTKSEPSPTPEDLFAFASAHRKRITPAAPNTRAAETLSPPSLAPPHVKRRTRSEPGSLATTALKFLVSLRERGFVLLEKAKDRIASFKWSNRLLNILGITLGTIVLMVVLFLIIHHLAAPSSARPPADDELILFTTPPEPYVD